MKLFKSLFLLVLIFLTAGMFGFINPEGNNTAADGDWTELGKTEGGPGGIYTSWTNIDSATATTSDYTTKLSVCDGQSQNDAEKYLSAFGYLAGNANDSVLVTIETKNGSSNLTAIVDTLGYLRGGTAKIFRVSLSGYGREYRVKATPHTSGDGTANASTCDLEISFYCAKLDQLNPVENYTKYRPGGGSIPGKLEETQNPIY